MNDALELALDKLDRIVAGWIESPPDAQTLEREFGRAIEAVLAHAGRDEYDYVGARIRFTLDSRLGPPVPRPTLH
ncbi:hypothetical protein K4L06_17695 [Lysobacter sp. BMK333-48F3]|uniref:hypothetical protein n=1 Tax=Lysobacter sp. BMK333-48F3 TaxID=2867962 RepID=UPI001C8CD2D3|nr:hypothetical protein [Lysobacter sp. BMK333-48F3]MBX9403146.1 hypothetical protein [Lysobacter sp. BMK333-48F3]